MQTTSLSLVAITVFGEATTSWQDRRFCRWRSHAFGKAPLPRRGPRTWRPLSLPAESKNTALAS